MLTFRAVDDASINLIVNELASVITGRAPGKIFQLGAATLAIDFGLRSDGYLLLSPDPSMPRLYLIQRRVRDLEKQSRPLSPFGLLLRKELANTVLATVEKEPGDRVVWFNFAGEDELGNRKVRKLVVRLTGRSANLLLLDEDSRVIQTLRSSSTNPIFVGSTYETSTAAPSSSAKPTDLLNAIRSGEFATTSAAADHYFTSRMAESAAAARIAAARAEMQKRIVRQEKLVQQLESDLGEHLDFERHKRLGDLLLANLNTAKRRGSQVSLIDYFADDAPAIEVEIDESASLQEEAARRFSLFSRSKRATEQIRKRIEREQARLVELKTEQQALETRIANGEFSQVDGASTLSAPARPSSKRQPETRHVPGARRYLSSDGLEILVGRTANDNDQLTFKMAQPNDTWLHAADYGGSHVVVRNPTRKEIPHRTLIEAAQLAAYFSQAKKNPKADVHYTPRKFVAKIKGGKPGLVRLQRFKTIAVEPKEAGTRL